MVRKTLTALAAFGLAFTAVSAAPTYAQPRGEEEVDDTGLWLMGAFVVSESILVAILASDDNIDREPPPVST